MKTIRHEIKEVMWPYAFLLNNHKTFRGFKEHLKSIFENEDPLHSLEDKDDPETLKAVKVVFKEINDEALRFYELSKTLPYKIEVVLSNSFCSVFARKEKEIEYDIYPHTPYQINDNDLGYNTVSRDEFQWFLNFFTDLHPEINPFEIHIDKASFLDVLLKEIRTEKAARTEVFLSKIGGKLRYKI